MEVRLFGQFGDGSGGRLNARPHSRATLESEEARAPVCLFMFTESEIVF